MLRSVTTAVFIGVLGGFWFALVTDGIELFQNYVEGAWRYQVGVRSFAAPLVGAVVGALTGANIRLALPSGRADGLTRGALTGAAVGVLLVLAQVVLVVLAAIFDDYRVFYQPLLTRFSGIIFIATLIGAAAGLLKVERSLAAPIPGAVVGALTAVAFLLPNVVTNALAVSTSGGSGASDLAFFAIYLLPSHLSILLAGIGSGAIIGAVHRRRRLGESDISSATIGVLMGTLAAVTASSPSFHYVVLGVLPPESSFSLAIYVFRVLVGSLVGSTVGLVAISISRRVASNRREDADTISRG